MKNKIIYYSKKTVRILLLSFLCHWLWSLAACEWNTAWCWKEFYGLDESINMLDASPTVKVIEYSNYEARVYYKSNEGGSVLRFERGAGDWELVWWNTVWSATGSADEFIWPYGR